MTARSVPAPRVPFALLVLGLLGGGLTLLLLLNTASAANELRRHDLASADADVSDQVEQVKVDVAAAQAPGRLAVEAAALGMVPATNPAFLVRNPDGSLRVAGTPAPVVATTPLAEVPGRRAVRPKATPSKRATTKSKAAKTKTKTKTKTTKTKTTTKPTASATVAKTGAKSAKPTSTKTAAKTPAQAGATARAAAKSAGRSSGTTGTTPTTTVVLSGGPR